MEEITTLGSGISQFGRVTKTFTADLLNILLEIFRSIYNFAKNNIWLVVPATFISLIFVVISFGFISSKFGLKSLITQGELFNGIDVIWECGPYAFGAENFEVDIGVASILQYIWIGPSALKLLYTNQIMKYNSAIVYFRQAIADVIRNLYTLLDWTNPLETIFALFTQITETIFVVNNVYLNVNGIRFPVMANLFNSLFLSIECQFLNLRQVLEFGMNGTLIAENCGVCELNDILRTNGQSCVFSTTTLLSTIFLDIDNSQTLNEIACNTSCSSPLCIAGQCIGYGLENSLNFFLEPCFNITVTPYVIAVEEGWCCLTKEMTKLIYIAIGLLENFIRDLQGDPGQCVTLALAENLLTQWAIDFSNCLSEFICALTSGEICDLVDLFLFLFQEIAEVYEAVKALIGCTTDELVIECIEEFPDTINVPCLLQYSLGQCTTQFYMCLENNSTLWQQAEPFFETIQGLMDSITPILCVPSCFVRDCYKTATGCSGFELSDCMLESVQCIRNLNTFISGLADILELFAKTYVVLLDFAQCFGNYVGRLILQCRQEANLVLEIACFWNGIFNTTLPFTASNSLTLIENTFVVCIMKGTQNGLSDCINGCYFDYNSCDYDRKSNWNSSNIYLEDETIQSCGGFKEFHVVGKIELPKDVIDYFNCLMVTSSSSLSLSLTKMELNPTAKRISKTFDFNSEKWQFFWNDPEQAMFSGLHSLWLKYKTSDLYHMLVKMSSMNNQSVEDYCLENELDCVEFKRNMFYALVHNYTSHFKSSEYVGKQWPVPRPQLPQFMDTIKRREQHENFMENTRELITVRPPRQTAMQAVNTNDFPILSTAYCFLFGTEPPVPKASVMKDHIYNLTTTTVTPIVKGLTKYSFYNENLHNNKMYQVVHMFMYHENTSNILKFLRGDSQDHKHYNPLDSTFGRLPFEIPKPTGEEIWNAQLNSDYQLGLFLTGLSINSITSSLGFDLYGDGDYSPQPSLSEIFMVKDQTKCFNYGISRACQRLYLSSVNGNEYDPVHLPTSLRYYKSEKTLQNHQEDNDDFNANGTFLGIIDYILKLLFGFSEDVFQEFIEKIIEVYQTLNVTEVSIKVLKKIDQETNCRWPTYVNGSTVYNILCAPLVGASLGRWVVEAPNFVIRSQIGWPKELLAEDGDCVNSWNGVSFSPFLLGGTAETNFWKQGVDNLLRFRVTNSCVVDFQFGQSLVLRSDINELVIGRPILGQNYSNSGSIVYYDLQNDAFIKTIYATDITQAEQLGQSMSYDSTTNTIAFGAPNANKHSGYVSVYEYKGNLLKNIAYTDVVTFEDQVTLKNDQGFALTLFGHQVILSTSWLIVSSPLYNYTAKGRVWVFDRSDDYSLYSTIDDYPALPSFGLFGWSIDMDKRFEDRIVIGQPGYNNSLGQVHIFHQVMGEWILEQKLTYPFIDSNSSHATFGWTVTTIESVACISAVQVNQVLCFKEFNYGDWQLSVIISEYTNGGFGNVTKMNDTHIAISEEEGDVVRVFEFSNNYTVATNVLEIMIPFMPVISIDFDDNGRFAIGGHEAVYIYPDDVNITTDEVDKYKEKRPYCPICANRCERTYIADGCNAVGFRDYIDEFFAFVSFIPYILNWLFKLGLKLTFLEETVGFVIFLIEILVFALLISLIMVPTNWPFLICWAPFVIPYLSVLFYFFLLAVKLFWGDGLPVAPLILTFYIMLFIPLPPFANYLQQVRIRITSPGTRLFTQIVIAIMLAQFAYLFYDFITPDFSYNEKIADLIDDVTGAGFIPGLIPYLPGISYKARRFIYEDPLEIPNLTVLCWIISIPNASVGVLAVPLLVFGAIFFWRARGVITTALYGYFQIFLLLARLLIGSVNNNT